jgi:DNA-binding NtrC family response regulator
MAISLAGKRILIVDDEHEICELVQKLLESAAVDSAFTYGEAQTKLTQNPYDVVILDIMGVDGHALLREFSSKLPCIMLTAHALTSDDMRRSYQGRAVLFLPKEELFRLDEYVAKVLEVPSRKSLWRWLFQKVDFRQYFAFDSSWFDDALADVTERDIIDDLEGRTRDDSDRNR